MWLRKFQTSYLDVQVKLQQSLCCAGFQDGLVRVFTTNSNEYLKVLKSRDELADQDPETQDLESVLRESDDKVKVNYQPDQVVEVLKPFRR